MTKKTKNRLAGTAGGVINGLFGGGGGMVLLPLLTGWSGLEARAAFATCVAIIFPMCCLSAAIYLFQVRPALSELLPYLLGAGLYFHRKNGFLDKDVWRQAALPGAAASLAASLLAAAVDVSLLRKPFGIFLLYSGGSMLWSARKKT